MDNTNLKEPYQIIDTSIGQIAVFGLTVGESIKIKKDLKTELKNSDSDKYILAFVKYTCHKVDNLIDSKYESVN
jgi:hypothetical protein